MRARAAAAVTTQLPRAVGCAPGWGIGMAQLVRPAASSFLPHHATQYDQGFTWLHTGASSTYISLQLRLDGVR